jgi:hypothetical protein
MLFILCTIIGIKETTRACCGTGEAPVNVNPLILCRASGIVNISCEHTANNVCSNPSEYVNWDGIHLMMLPIALFHKTSSLVDICNLFIISLLYATLVLHNSDITLALRFQAPFFPLLLTVKTQSLIQ